jgi:hypothetical protein
MSLEKPRKLMEVLVRRTRKGEIDWQESFPDMFQVSFKDNSVQLRAESDQVRETVVYTVSLLNSEGEVADRFTDEDLDNEQFGRTGGRWFKELGELHNLARRRARGADQVLDAILKEVDDDDIPF